MLFTGTIQSALPEQSGTTAAGKQWRRKDYILLYDNANPQYPKTVLFSVMGDNIDKLSIQQGQQYDIEIDFSTREYSGRMYMSATAWKATLKDAPQQQPAPVQQTPQDPFRMAPPAYQQQPAPMQQSDDLPF